MYGTGKLSSNVANKNTFDSCTTEKFPNFISLTSLISKACFDSENLGVSFLSANSFVSTP